MKVAIVKYNAGNVSSVEYALNRLGIAPVITDDEQELLAADKVIFPGVGEASTAMRYLKDKDLHLLLPKFTQPVLGVCLGQQLLCDRSEENDAECLGLIPIDVKKFPAAPGFKVPHMGWNTVHGLKGPLFKGIAEHSHVYFVHSYFVKVCAYTAAVCDYAVPFSAALQKDNFFAVQFHPEKSGETGAKILENFIKL